MFSRGLFVSQRSGVIVAVRTIRMFNSRVLHRSFVYYAGANLKLNIFVSSVGVRFRDIKGPFQSSRFCLE